MKIILIFITITLSFSVMAKFDLEYGAQGRSYPSIGASAFVNSGYNFNFWGSPSKENPLYGLIRPYVNVTTSAVVNTVEGAIEIYPVSFLGLVVGSEYNNSTIDLPFFDCDVINCRGATKSKFYTLRAALGFAGVILVGELRREKVEYDYTDKPYGDFFHALVADTRDGEDFVEKKLILGFDTKSFLVAAVSEFARYETSDQEKKNTMLVFRKYTSDGYWTVGAGNFEAGNEDVGDSQVERGTIFVFQWAWKVSDSLKIF